MLPERTIPVHTPQRRKRARRLLDLLFAVVACAAANLLAQSAAVYPLFVLPLILASGSMLALAESRWRDG